MEIAVTLEVPLGDDIEQATTEWFWRSTMERMRTEAERVCAGVQGRVMTDRMPTILQPRIGEHPTFGGDWMLIASRWWVEVPDSFEPDQVIHGAPEG